jgi:hypothetical protein
VIQTVSIPRAKKGCGGGLPELSEKRRKRGGFREISGVHGHAERRKTRIYAAEAGRNGEKGA